MKKLIITTFILFQLSSNLNSQGRFSLSLDYSRFKNNGGNSYVEFYFGFDVTALDYKNDGKQLNSEAIVTLIISKEKNDSIVAVSQYRAPFTLSDTLLLKTARSFVDVNGFILQPDLYRAKLKITDFNNPKKGDSISVLISVEKIENNTFVKVSDIELSSSIISAEPTSDERFVKNSYEVKPNPTKIFSNSQPILFYYLELYNLSKKEWASLKVKTAITNSFGEEVLSKEHFKQLKSSSVVDVGAIKVFNLRTGSYILSYSITDTLTKELQYSSKRFFIYNKDLPSEDVMSGKVSSVMSSEYATMNAIECDRDFDYLRYIATKGEIDQFKKLRTVESKREYLFEYWKNRETLYTGKRSAKVEYFERINIANNSYKSGFKEGWKSDRGRVYILYGPSDEIERHANEVDVKPYEIWFYHGIQGGVQFIFGDRTGYSDYVMLHSTHRDELHDDTWRSQILSK